MKDTAILIFNAAYDSSIVSAVSSIFDSVGISWRDKQVLVKPNLLSSYPPEAAVTTHPSLVKAVVMHLLDAGAKVIVGDNPGLEGYGRSEKVAEACGIVSVSQGCYVPLSRNSIKHPIKSKFMDYVAISREVLEADYIVNLPKLKTHGLTFLTGAIKNCFGYIVGGDKMRVHSRAKTPWQFAEALLDIYKIHPPELNIMDAVEAMEGNGPSKGSKRHLGKILAGANAVSLDCAAVKMLGKKISDIPHLELAGKQHLGETDFSKLNVQGPFEVFTDFKFPATFLPGVMGIVLNRILSGRLSCAPEIDEKLCGNCLACLDHCPMQAIEQKADKLIIDHDKCIHCYCCQELCPTGAVKLRGRVLSFVRRVY